MTEALIGWTIVFGLVTAEAWVMRRAARDYLALGEETEDLPPRLDHAAPGGGRTPRAFCLLLERAGLPPGLDAEAPCTSE